MLVFEALRTRRSIRKYKPIPVEKEKLDLIMEVARTSPSSSNKQQWKFVVVQDKKKLEQFTGIANGQTFVGTAPVIIAACGPLWGKSNCGQNRHTVDCSIACSYMMLAAHDVGLGTCWLGNFQQDAAREILGVPEDWEIVALLTLGYPDETPVMRPRKTTDEVVRYDTF